MPVNKMKLEPFYLLWSVPASIIAVAAVTGNQHLIAVGIGLVGALSLSGSI